jgi:hypothetical protein
MVAEHAFPATRVHQCWDQAIRASVLIMVVQIIDAITEWPYEDVKAV